MLDSTGTRQLAYLVRIDDITPMNADRLECVHIGGWHCVCGKGEFHVGDIGVYFEIDSKLPEVAPFTEMEFLVSKHYKIKTQKIRGEYSQGLLVPVSTFGWHIEPAVNPWIEGGYVSDESGKFTAHLDDESRFLTAKLGVTYAVAEDNARKANVDKYKVMAQHHAKIARTAWWRWLYKHEWGKKLLFAFFGRKKKDNAKAFPTGYQYIHKSDEERVESIPFILQDTDEWVKSVKIDGTSSLYLLVRKPFHRFEYFVCSRNVRQLERNQQTYFADENVYWQVEDKFHIRAALEDLLNKHPDWEYVAIQGETAGVSENGVGIQGNPHKFNELRFFCYNFIESVNGRWDSVKGRDLVADYGIEWVPIVDEHYHLISDMEEFKLSADGLCEAPGASGLREGYVYRRRIKDGVDYSGKMMSFKNVSREYLLKH